MVRVKTESKRAQLMKAAKEIFLEVGFDRTLMTNISERAKCSKGTLYSYFSSKEELFFEVVIGQADLQTMTLFNESEFDREVSIEKFLSAFGLRFLSTLYSPDFLARRRLALSDKASPGARRIVYERGIRRYEEKLAYLLERRMERGDLKEKDAHVAAAQLCGLLESELLLKFLLGIELDTSASALETLVERAVSTFLNGYHI